MRYHVLTLFPEAFSEPLQFSIVSRAVQRGQVAIDVTDIRDHTHDAHGTADDYQFGGGHGMVMKPEPAFEAAEAALSGYTSEERAQIPVLLMTPPGRTADSKARGGTGPRSSDHTDLRPLCRR